MVFCPVATAIFLADKRLYKSGWTQLVPCSNQSQEPDGACKQSQGSSLSVISAESRDT